MKSRRLSLVLVFVGVGWAANGRSEPINSWGSSLVDLQVGDYFDIAATGAQSEASVFFNDERGHSAHARAYADYGRNHVFASATNTGERSTTSFAEAISVWNEQFQIGGGNGFAEASVEVHLDGAITVHGQNVFAPALSFELYYVPQAGATLSQFPILWSNGNELADGVGVITPRSLVGTFTFEYDQPFIMYGSLRALVADNATIDVFHSARVNSIVFPRGALIDNEGGPQARTALRINGIPEPTTLAMALLALLLLLTPAFRHQRK